MKDTAETTTDKGRFPQSCPEHKNEAADLAAFFTAGLKMGCSAFQ
jgi:hypothetical protein